MEIQDLEAQHSHVDELALSACTHVESRTKGIPCRQFQGVRAWVAWIREHLPHAILQLHHARIVAAFVWHAAWGMECGDGFPSAKGLVRQFLDLSAADCGQAAELHLPVVNVDG